MRLLAFAYACEPEEGSEPGAGWMWARMLARHGETWVITRTNNRERIEAAFGDLPERDRLHPVYVDLPGWARFWKRGPRGLRLYYLLWLLAALRVGRRLHRSMRFDVTWHLTLANAWLGSSGALVGSPFVFGPVGGGVAPPWSLVWPTGARSVASEILRAASRAVGRYLNPLARLSWRRAIVILAQNPDTVAWLPRQHRSKARVIPNVVFSTHSDSGRPGDDRPRTALFAGRLIPWKGADLAIAAVSKTRDWRLIIYGEGPDEHRLRGIVRRAGVGDRVEFRGHVARGELLGAMRTEAGVFLFPSLHDEAGWVVAEAVAAALPVVCLDKGGPPLLANGLAVTVPVHGGRAVVTSRLSAALERARTMSTSTGDVSDAYWIERRAASISSIIQPLLGGRPVAGKDDEDR